MVYLNDIAEITGDRADILDKLKNLVIGFSPALGESQIVTEDFLKLVIKRGRIPIEDIELNSPPKIGISRKYYEVTPEQVRGAVKEFIEKKLVPERLNPGMEANSGKVVIGNINYNGRILLPSQDFSYEINAGGSAFSADQVFLNINFKSNGKILKGVNAVVDLKVLLPSVAALRNIKRGETVSDGDIHIEEREVNRDTAHLITNIKEVVGKQAKSDIKTGDVITKNSVETLPVVMQGDVVSIVAESTVLRITAKGVAREKGGKGDLVKVLNVSSNRVIHARVIDSNIVMVEF
ncbi:MAG: flagellar basal body P-ring formation protein FlgA [Nitrospinae bacterium]|nr:flagellar basal body P-ring formation protein FlgA [Nitrospinota bacterium]